MPGNADLRAQYEKCGDYVVAALAKADVLCKAVGYDNKNNDKKIDNNDVCGNGMARKLVR